MYKHTYAYLAADVEFISEVHKQNLEGYWDTQMGRRSVFHSVAFEILKFLYQHILWI